MAGRGTDIILGPDSEKNRQKVLDLGGLYVIGTNRHESRRIDDQLRGRAGRQGDPGTTRFFISLDDDLITRFCVRDLLPQEYRNHHQETPINDPAVIENIAHVQRVIEGQNLEIRKTLWKYSSLMEKQRNIIHEIRYKILEGDGYTSLLAAESSARWAQLCADFGEDLLKEVEQQITLYYIDRYWADHIAMASEIKESIYLVSAGGTIPIFGRIDPLEYFRHEVNTAYELLWENIRNDIITTFNKAEITANGIDSDKEGLRGPSSTWTFLINDNPYGEGLDKIIKNVKRLLRKR
jgi:preprotein translocase subunit SecA